MGIVAALCLFCAAAESSAASANPSETPAPTASLSMAAAFF